jgi:hypothetical protein
MKVCTFTADLNDLNFILPPSPFIISQVVRQRSAKPFFIGSIPIAASKSLPMRSAANTPIAISDATSTSHSIIK